MESTFMMVTKEELEALVERQAEKVRRTLNKVIGKIYESRDGVETDDGMEAREESRCEMYRLICLLNEMDDLIKRAKEQKAEKTEEKPE